MLKDRRLQIAKPTLKPNFLCSRFCYILREFELRHNRYAFCRVALVDKIAIPLPVQSCAEGMVSYPKLAN